MPSPDELPPPKPQIDSPEDAWREIEGTLGISEPDPWFRARVASYVDLQYDDPTDEPRSRVRPAHLRQALTELRDLSTRLAEYLRLQYGTEPTDSPIQWARFHVVADLLRRDEQRAFAATLRGLARKAGAAIRKLPSDKGGRSADLTFLGFVHALATLYVDMTHDMPGVSQPPGGGAYGGPFFRFVEAVSRHLVPARHRKKTNGALGKAIERALANWRRKSGATPQARSVRRIDNT